MKFRISWMVLTAMLAFGMLTGLARAEGEEGGGAEPDPTAAMAEMVKEITATTNAMVKFSGSTRLTEANVKSLLKHGKSFEEAGKNQDGEDEVEQALEANFKKTGVYDFELLFELAPVKAWAKKAGVAPRPFVQAFMRFQALGLRENLLTYAEGISKRVPETLAQLEKGRSVMGEEAYQAAKKAAEAQLAMVKPMKAASKSVPAVTPDEKKLVAKHGAALRRVLDVEDDEEGDDEGEDAHDEGDDEEGDDDR